MFAKKDDHAYIHDHVHDRDHGHVYIYVTFTDRIHVAEYVFVPRLLKEDDSRN